MEADINSPERRRSLRFTVQLRAELRSTLVYSVQSNLNQGNLLRIDCHTRDISEIGLSLVVTDAGRAGQALPGEESLMLVMLELPDGPVAIEAAPIRYQRLKAEVHSDFLIGARITNIGESDHARYVAYLSALS